MENLMPASQRRILAGDLISDADYARQRRERRAALLPVKRLRRIALGPYCTLIFESYDTMLFQIQEMLLTEKGGESQIADELAAYNPLVPQGRELVATVMFEIADPVRRAEVLGGLAGVGEHFHLVVGAERIGAVPEGDIERDRADGKTSSVHFLHFPMTPDQVATFRDPEAPAMVGCDHPRYGHIASLSPETRAELARDLA